MNKNEEESPRIIFMGTPEFAVASLRILDQNKFNIVGVITAPDRQGGRGMKKIITSSVKKYAQARDLHLLQPTNLKDPSFLKELKALNADLQMVVAFRMLPEAVWSMPPLGTINLHASLLPAYRGAAPINWAIINGEKETGLTTFFIEKKIDTGNILQVRKLGITPDDTAGTLHDRMMHLGAELVLDTVQAVIDGDVEPQLQDHSRATKAPKIFRKTCEINFDQPVEKVYNFIRGMSPYPGAWTTLDSRQLKIKMARITECDHAPEPGKLLTDQKTYLWIGTRSGWLEILELQIEGRKQMHVGTFLRGYNFSETKRLK